MLQRIASQSSRNLHPPLDFLRSEFHDESVVDLFERFLKCPEYSRELALELIAVGRGEGGESWECRRLAARMLQEHLLGLSVDDLEEFDFLLCQLRAKHPGRRKLPKSVFKEGYSTRKLRGFVRQFRRRLKRPPPVIGQRLKRCVTVQDVRHLIRESRQECKLALGRYLFSPDEVVAKIFSQVKLATGMGVALDDRLVRQEIDWTLAELPEYESAILQKLRAGGHVLWVSNETPSKLNSLVEYPLGTVVLCVKPPGSHHEIEFKRAGRRGEQPLRAVMRREGHDVPPSHRLDGGSMVSGLNWEAQKSAIFSHVFRHVHDRSAPLTQIIDLISKFKIPLAEGEQPTIKYLSEAAVYGDGFASMRDEMARVVEAFRRDRGDQVKQIPGDLGLTVQFVAFAAPTQAVICGSSSFRLDLVARYLSAEGPEEYFRGLGVEFDNSDAQSLADDLLDEVLGIYDPPHVQYTDHRAYVETALAVPTNRKRADATYIDLLEQIGVVWGTLWAMRGYSYGESFVSRNVGLRSMWSGGRWRIRLVFHDHDNLVIPAADQREFHPHAALGPMQTDERYIGATTDDDALQRELNCLKQIYAVSGAVRITGQKRMRHSLKRAYVKTQKAIISDRHIRRRFHHDFRTALHDWDAAVRMYLKHNGSAGDHKWKPYVKKRLKAKGVPKHLIKSYCDALEQHGDFVNEYAFVFGQ